MSLPSPFPPPLPSSTASRALLPCAKGGKWAVLKRFRVFFHALFRDSFPPFQPSNPKAPGESICIGLFPLGMLGAALLRNSTYAGDRRLCLLDRPCAPVKPASIAS